MPQFRYSLFGLEVASELELPELAAVPGDGAAAIVIRLGTIRVPEAGPGYSLSGPDTLLTVPEVGRFIIRAGSEILIDPAGGATERNVRLYLLGSAMGALLHQRGLLPLHANAIEIGGGAVAFCGHSGAGKSTMAAWFHDRGHRLLADDVCVITVGEDGRALAWPGVPRLRLWRDALEESGRSVESYGRSFESLDKWDVPTAGAEARPAPLERVYVLARAAERGGPLVRRLVGVAAAEALIANTYRGGWVRIAGRTGPHLSRCLEIARAVPVFEARRVWGFDEFDRQAELLREHALTGSLSAA